MMIKTNKLNNNHSIMLHSRLQMLSIYLQIIYITFLFTITFQFQAFYYPVSFGSPSYYYSSVALQNQKLSVLMQFSSNFTTTDLEFIQLDQVNTEIARWSQTVSILPYNFTKSYIIWTEVRIIIHPSVKNPNITINLNFYIDDMLYTIKYFNFMQKTDNTREYLAPILINYDNQEVEVFVQQCLSTWDGWSLNLEYPNGTQIYARQSSGDNYCTVGNQKPISARYYFISNQTTIYPSLIPYTSSALPASYSFYMQFYIRFNMYCGDVANSPRLAQNQTYCFCDAFFIYNVSSHQCVINCLLFPDTVGLVPGSDNLCVCVIEKVWDPINKGCVCPTQFLYNGSQCIRNCTFDLYSNGYLQNGSNSQCGCIYEYVWDFNLNKCVKNCFNVLNSNKTLNYSFNFPNQCSCDEGFEWSVNMSNCLKDCSNIQFSTKQIINDPNIIKCQCLQGYAWNQNKCSQQISFFSNSWGISAVALSGVAIIVTVIGVGILIKKYLIKKLSRVNPHKKGGQITQYQMRIQSMKIVDFYQ